MNSRYYFSYATSFFILLFFGCYILKEPGLFVGKALFALTIALVYETASFITNIDWKVQIIFGLIMIALGWFLLAALRLEYTLLLLGAFIPQIFFSFVEMKMGIQDYRILCVSLIEVFSFAFALIGLSSALMSYFSIEVPGFVFNGAEQSDMLATMFVSILTIIFSTAYVKKQKNK